MTKQQRVIRAVEEFMPAFNSLKSTLLDNQWFTIEIEFAYKKWAELEAAMAALTAKKKK